MVLNLQNKELLGKVTEKYDKLVQSSQKCRTAESIFDNIVQKTGGKLKIYYNDNAVQYDDFLKQNNPP